jgi:hypothetical protein
MQRDKGIKWRGLDGKREAQENLALKFFPRVNHEAKKVKIMNIGDK